MLSESWNRPDMFCLVKVENNQVKLSWVKVESNRFSLVN
jgi:hypothetical protein